jgi:hypothetical protein
MWRVGQKWGYFDSISFRIDDPTIRFFHSACFNASLVDRANELTRLKRGDFSSPIKLKKNVYDMPPLFVADVGILIVNRHVKELLAHVAKVDFVPACIAEAWEYRCDPGDRRYEHDAMYDDDLDADDIVSAFAHRYRVSAPQVDLYGVIDYSRQVRDDKSRRNPEEYPDHVVYKIAGTKDGRNSGSRVVSKEFLEAWQVAPPTPRATTRCAERVV